MSGLDHDRRIRIRDRVAKIGQPVLITICIVSLVISATLSVVVWRQQGQISAATSEISSVQGSNKALLHRLANDEQVVVVYARFIGGTLNWEANIVAPLCAVSPSHRCPPPPVLPKLPSKTGG